MTNSRQPVITRNIGRNRGKPRIWLEGAILHNNGLQHGKRWNIEHANGQITITESPNGKRKVAGKPGRPIIDMSASSVTKAIDCETFNRVMVTPVGNGKLVLTAIED